MKTPLFVLVSTLVSSLLFAPFSWAEDSPQQSCKNAAALYDDGDIEGALEEARWCVTLMEQEQQENTQKFFLDEINGFKGNQLESQNAMGFQVVSREYHKGEQYIQVNLNGGNGGSAMQAFAALAQMGMQGTGKKLRIQKRTANLINDNGNITLSITLRSGGILLMESSDVNQDTLLAFAKAFPVAEMDDSRN